MLEQLREIVQQVNSAKDLQSALRHHRGSRTRRDGYPGLLRLSVR